MFSRLNNKIKEFLIKLFYPSGQVILATLQSFLSGKGPFNQLFSSIVAKLHNPDDCHNTY